MAKDVHFNSIFDLIKVFPTERDCHQYLAGQRWGGLMECPYKDCNNDRCYVFRDGIRYKCTSCKRIYTAKTGSFMEGSGNRKLDKAFSVILKGSRKDK